MIPLSRDLVKHIEGLLEPGYLVQLEQVGHDVKVRKVARDESIIWIEPTLVSTEGDTLASLILRKGGEDPVYITDVTIPEGYWITGIMGARNLLPATDTGEIKKAVKKRLARGD